MNKSKIYFLCSVTEIKENEEYKVGFNSNGLQLFLTVELGPGFPNEKPRLTISPIVSHHWISSTGEVQNAPGLTNVSLFVLDFNSN